MSIISLNKVTKTFASFTVLDNVSFELSHQSKVGLVGENGSGKSTILKLITGAIKPDSGELSVARSSHVCHVPQMPDLRSHLTVYEEILTARSRLQVWQTVYQI